MGNKITNVLFPIDFISVSANPLTTAIRLAKTFNANLHLVEVNNKGKGVDKLKLLAQTLANSHNIRCITKSLRGSMPVAIVEYASLNGIDLIVLSSKKMSKWKRLFIRDHRHYIVNESTCPSLIIPEDKTSVIFHKILFPIRFHGGALMKYRFLKQFLSFDSACIRLLVLSKSYSELADKQLQKIVNAVNEQLEHDEVQVSGSVNADGNFSKAVLQMSKSMEADLIVITGDSDIEQHKKLFNNYQKDIINRSQVPVLNIKTNLLNSALN